MGAGTGGTDTKVLRGTTVNQDNNDAILNSRFRTNAFSGPDCTANDPGGIDTVLAEEVMDLSTFVRPFVAE